MTPDNQQSDKLWLLLGEIKGDLKYLVEERRSTNRRLDEVEADMALKIKDQGERLTKLETFKVRIGVFVSAVSVLVPTAITIIARKFGLL